MFTFQTFFTFRATSAKKKDCNESTLLKPVSETVINFQKIKVETDCKLVVSLLDKVKLVKKYFPKIHFS